MDRRVGFARWRSAVVSGGNRYDEALVAGLGVLGVDLREYPLGGPWPFPRAADRLQLARVLSAEQEWIIGNILASAAPEEIAAATSSGRRVTVLLHYFPADDPAISPPQRESLHDSEAQVIAAASAVVVTSAWAAREVSGRYGREDAVVAIPGVDPAESAPGSASSLKAPRLLWLGSLTQTKDPLLFIEALAFLRDLDWTARIVGPDTVDEALSQEVRERLTQTGLAGRVRVLGPREGEELESVWAQTDLLVHTSRSETYAMVVGEAVARGIPSIVPCGTGAVEAQRVGSIFVRGDAEELSGSLRAWLSDPRLRESWRARAQEERAHLPTWAATAENVMAALTCP